LSQIPCHCHGRHSASAVDEPVEQLLALMEIMLSLASQMLGYGAAMMALDPFGPDAPPAVMEAGER
jgi:hypothetical protein